jgi:hypothetical protein
VLYIGNKVASVYIELQAEGPGMPCVVVRRIQFAYKAVQASKLLTYSGRYAPVSARTLDILPENFMAFLGKFKKIHG